MLIKNCQECNADYTDQDSKRFGHCPNCDSSLFIFTLSSRQPASSMADASGLADKAKPNQRIKREYLTEASAKPKRNVPAELDDLVEAQNRTTHAVRSLAITLVAAPIISIAIIVAVVVAYASGNTSLIVVTGALGAIIGIATLVVSIEELRKSKVS